MREPDFELDGWCLDDGEAYHNEAPDTFWIPDREERERLGPGDLAKLIFRIDVGDRDEPVAVERMWVVVRERVSGGYFGLLDNNPYCLAENYRLWSGAEVPFSAHHVIDVDTGDERTAITAQQIPRRGWPRS